MHGKSASNDAYTFSSLIAEFLNKPASYSRPKASIFASGLGLNGSSFRFYNFYLLRIVLSVFFFIADADDNGG